MSAFQAEKFQSPELRALLKQMDKERQTFDERLRTVQVNVIEVKIAAHNVMQCARAIAVYSDGALAREGGALQ